MLDMLQGLGSLYVNGEWVRVDERDAVINPADESLLMMAPVGNTAIVEMAISAAREAFDKGPWPRLKQAARQATLTGFLDVVTRRKQEICELIVAEAGATQMLTEFLQYGITLQHARHMVALSGRPAITPLPVETAVTARGTTNLAAGAMSREPIGVVAAITPYNFPFFLNIGKVIPALAVGCTVVLKPSPYTPLEALILGEIADEAGLPKGVLNIVTGDNETGRLLTSDKRVDLIHFTGSDKVGALVQAQAAPTLKRCVLELGGKSAMIVRADADLQQAAAAGLAGIMTHCGQGCVLQTRQLVHNSVRSQYIELLKAMLRQVKVGDPADPSVTCGPLIREVARKRSEDYVEIALAEGAKLVAGGKRPAGLDKGFFFEPTLFDEVDNRSRVAREEIFGPIGAVIGFDTDEEAIALANDSEFGLSGGIWSANPAHAFEMALQLRTGGVQINGGSGRMSSHAPFGGIKRSGYGREYGEEGLNEFSYIKTIGFRAA
jgi:aldehyde dehydrogenase (NAD+)